MTPKWTTPDVVVNYLLCPTHLNHVVRVVGTPSERVSVRRRHGRRERGLGLQHRELDGRYLALKVFRSP